MTSFDSEKQTNVKMSRCQKKNPPFSWFTRRKCFPQLKRSCSLVELQENPRSPSSLVLPGSEALLQDVTVFSIQVYDSTDGGPEDEIE